MDTAAFHLQVVAVGCSPWGPWVAWCSQQVGAAGCYLWVENAGYHLQVEVVECNPQTKSELRWVVLVVEVEFFRLDDHLSHLRSTIIPLQY